MARKTADGLRRQANQIEALDRCKQAMAALREERWADAHGHLEAAYALASWLVPTPERVDEQGGGVNG